MLFRRNIAIRFRCSPEKLSEMLQNREILAECGLRRGKGSLLIAVNPNPGFRNSFLPQVSVRILSDPEGCSLIASFSLRKSVRRFTGICLFLTLFLDLLCFSAVGLSEGLIPVLLLPLLWVIFLTLGELMFRKSVREIGASFMRIRL